jgi:hypothetical protein
LVVKFLQGLGSISVRYHCPRRPNPYIIRREVLTAVIIKIMNFWDVTP